MTTLNDTLEAHHKGIILALGLMIIALLASCTFHNVIPACHWIFGCDHRMHAAASLLMAYV